MDERANNAKAWCFDNGITEEQVKAAWDNAAGIGNQVINQFIRSGMTWCDLSPRLLGQLIERYGV